MMRDISARKPRSRLAKFGFIGAGITLILAGVLLLMMGELLVIKILGMTVPPEAPGLIVVMPANIPFTTRNRRSFFAVLALAKI